MKHVFLSFIAAVALTLPAKAEVQIAEVTSSGGIDAWLVEEPSIPFVALEIRFRGGGSLDAADKRGATHLMMGLLEEGAGDLDSQGFAEAVEGLAASFDYDTYDDAVTISARFLTENRDEAVALLRSSLVEPLFGQVDVDRVRDQVLSGLRSDAVDPDEIVGSRYYALAFPDHPYGSSRRGTIESVSALTRDDIVAAHRGALALDRVYVGAVGDITAEELGPLLDTLLGDLPSEGATLPERVEYTLDGGVTVVPFDTPQSVAQFGQRGLKRDDPDFFPAFVLNQILGAGGFESRLTEEVRVKRGLTYGVYSYLLPKDNAELLLGRVASSNARIAEAIDVIRAEWQRLAADGVSQDELDRAKTYLTGAYPLRFDGNARIASIMVGMQMDGLGTDYIATRNDKVNAVTLEDVNRVAAELLDPDGLHFVIVGQPEGLTESN